MEDGFGIERVFRQANTIIAEHLEAAGERGTVGGFVCECADETCSDRVELSLAEFRQIEARANRFVLLPGHDLAEADRLVDANDRYVVVEKDPVEEKSPEANFRSGD